MKKSFLLLMIIGIAILGSACTKQVVFLDNDITNVKKNFDKFVLSTGYSYRLKDDENNIYNVDVGQINLQYLLNSKPIVSYNTGFTCKFKELGRDTLMDCKTYGNERGIYDVRRHLKEQKWDNVQFVSYKKYKKTHNL